ncbi:MAG: hypothetical protein QMB08_05355 [Acidimicrobiales bacterium]
MADLSKPVLREFSGTVADLHALPMPTESESAELWVMRPTGCAVVMGSSQRPDRFDEERLRNENVALAPRRSGGGAVFIDPASTVWIDVLAPRSSQLWSSDLAENFLVVGRLWHKALRSVGIETELCGESPARTDAAALACWAGSGWGELLVGPAKIVGLSQRRTRWGSRVQTMAVVDGSSARVVDYLMPQDRAKMRSAIPTHNLGIGTGSVEAAVLNVFGATR